MSELLFGATGVLAAIVSTTPPNSPSFQLIRVPDQRSSQFVGSMYIGGGGQNALPPPSNANGAAGQLNTGIGIGALRDVTSGDGNTATGNLAMASMLTGHGNTATGYKALYTATDVVSSDAYGSHALETCSAGGNAAFGNSAGRLIDSGGNNSAYGNGALYLPGNNVNNATVNGTNNSAFGFQTGAYDSSDPSRMALLGDQALGVNDSVAVGHHAQVRARYGVALGAATVVSASGGVALGVDHLGGVATSTVQDQITLGTVLHNLAVGSGAGAGGGVGVISIHNANTNPSTDPANGGILYADAGALKYRGSSGTVTTVAAA